MNFENSSLVSSLEFLSVTSSILFYHIGQNPSMRPFQSVVHSMQSFLPVANHNSTFILSRIFGAIIIGNVNIWFKSKDRTLQTSAPFYRSYKELLLVTLHSIVSQVQCHLPLGSTLIVELSPSTSIYHQVHHLIMQL